MAWKHLFMVYVYECFFFYVLQFLVYSGSCWQREEERLALFLKGLSLRFQFSICFTWATLICSITEVVCPLSLGTKTLYRRIKAVGTLAALLFPRNSLLPRDGSFWADGAVPSNQGHRRTFFLHLSVHWSVSSQKKSLEMGNGAMGISLWRNTSKPLTGLKESFITTMRSECATVRSGNWFFFLFLFYLNLSTPFFSCWRFADYRADICWFMYTNRRWCGKLVGRCECFIVRNLFSILWHAMITTNCYRELLLYWISKVELKLKTGE